MPEGNTIHWLARMHARDFAGRRVRAASPQGRFAREARRLDGRRFEGAEAYGKHLFHHWEGGLVVHVHLGMAGWFYRHPAPAPPPRETVRLRLATREVATDLIGPPTCELIPEFERRKLLARLGPDPLRRDFDPDRARGELVRRPRRTIGDALLDQRVLAGVGNIYRAEALFLTGIHPKRKSSSLSDEEWERLWKTVRALMRRGVVRGRIRTIERGEPPAHPLAGRGPDDAFYVYQQGVCRRCGSPIEEFPMSARRMFACPRCQPQGRRRPKAQAREKSGRDRKRRAAAP
jgi:endonuclease-8